MNADEFAVRLFEAAPSVSDFRKQGFDSDAVLARLRDSYICVPRSLPVSYKGYDDPILDLFGKYDVSKVEMAQFRFDSEIVMRGNLYFFGHLETDFIALDRVSGEILRFYYYNMELVEACAVDGAHFLGALLEIARFTAYPFEDDEIPEFVERATMLAGGQRYKPFYEALL